MTTSRDIVIYQGQAFALSLPYAGTAGRGQRMHIRTATAAATVVQILTHDGDANARVLFDGTDAIDVTIGASFSELWLVGADRVEWVYDIEDYALADTDDVVITHRGKCVVYGNRTRPGDVEPADQVPSGFGYFVRFDTDAQGLSAGQQLAARTNIGAGTGGGGGSGDVVGPASATDDRIAAFDGVTGKLIKQGTVTATAVASHLGSTANPHSVTAAQVGADATGTAAAAVVAHAGATDPHADRAFATSEVGTHAALTTAHGISAFGATLVDDADASTARTTLGLGTAATSATGDFAAASHTHAASAITSGTLAHERGGLEADVSAYSGLVKITAGATSAVTVTAAGEALLDDADASAQRTTLGLGGAAVLAVGITAGTVAAGDDSRLTDDRTASGLRETAGPTVLTLGAVADGEYLVRSGTTVVGGTPAGGGGSSNTKWVGAGELIPRVTNGAGIDGEELATNDINLDYLAFDSATSEGAQVAFAWPGAYTTFTATFYWTAASGSGTVTWTAAARCYADDDALDQAQGTAQSVTDTLLLANDAHKSSATAAVTPGGTVASGNLTVVQITRDIADTLAVDARLIGVMLEFA